MTALTVASGQSTADIVELMPVGLDIGNGAVKLCLPGHEIRVPSYACPVHENLHDPPETGLVEFVASSADREEQRWLAGYAAYQHNPEGYLKVVDDRQGKLTYGLPLLLGALATVRYRPVWNIFVVASIHHARAMGEALTHRLQGRHLVRFNGLETISEVSITIAKVLDEGAGAIAYCPEADRTHQTLVYDLGSGTTVVTVFGPKGRLIDRQVSNRGVQNLIDAIAKNPRMIRRLAAEGDREIIRDGIERGDFIYGIQGAWSFEAIYRDELKPWLSTVLKPALKAGAKWTPTSRAVIAIGGGSELPLVRELLQGQGITPVPEGSWSNARGLKRIALALGG
ncbi:ParM/StbA family protein [Halomicronema sp. CCY15110]|uniref:ParM/StbA family protein n=1 Tax=Halomicronema sp. CCY15110 TaxID=2767773 RepID=UPI00194E4115|nr:hypothetical protein [Halomicronema sp. CCY15110]